MKRWNLDSVLRFFPKGIEVGDTITLGMNKHLVKRVGKNNILVKPVSIDY